MFFVFIEILFKMLLFKGGVLIYAEHCIHPQIAMYLGRLPEGDRLKLPRSQRVSYLLTTSREVVLSRQGLKENAT